MKKILSLFLTFTMMCSIVLSLGACRKENNDDNNKNHGDTNNNQNNQEDKSYLASILAAEDEKFKLIETNLEKIGYYGIATDDYEDIVNELNSKKENQEVVSLNSADNKYTVYVDKCLGKAYYQNNETGYVLSSMRENDKSQVEVKWLHHRRF